MGPWPAVAKGEPAARPLSLARRPAHVPDVAYVSNERPPPAPDVDDKIDVYLRAGSTLVIVVDPPSRTVELHDTSGPAYLDESASIEHAALPGFSYAVRDLFAVLRRA